VSNVPRFPAPGKTAKKRLSCASLVGVTVIVFMTALLNFAAAAQAQTTGRQPNIIFIMGDDIGWSNIGAYNQGIMAGRTRPISTDWLAKACGSPIITPKPAALPVAQTSSPGNYRSARA
jgi:hypothetical protein